MQIQPISHSPIPAMRCVARKSQVREHDHAQQLIGSVVRTARSGERDDDGKRHRWCLLHCHALPGALKPYSRTVVQTWTLYSE